MEQAAVNRKAEGAEPSLGAYRQLAQLAARTLWERKVQSSSLWLSTRIIYIYGPGVTAAQASPKRLDQVQFLGSVPMGL